jgi:hypothetical protein
MPTILATTMTLSPTVSWADTEQPPYLALSITRIPTSTLTAFGPPADASDSERQVTIGLSRFRHARSTFDLVLDYQYTRYEYDGVASRNRDLHRLQVPLVFQSETAAWRYHGYLALGISTSSNVFKDFLNRGGREDLHLSGRIEARRHHDRDRWILGASFDRNFGRARFYPVIGRHISSIDNLDLRIAYPDPYAQFMFSERHSVTARLFPAGHEWHVVSDDFSSDFQYRVKALRTQLTWSINVTGHLTLDVTGGIETGRRHSFVDDQGSAFDSDLDDEWLFAVGIRIGPSPLPFPNGSGYAVFSDHQRPRGVE